MGVSPLPLELPPTVHSTHESFTHWFHCTPPQYCCGLKFDASGYDAYILYEGEAASWKLTSCQGTSSTLLWRGRGPLNWSCKAIHS